MVTKPVQKRLAQPDKKEARARRKAAKTLPEEFSLDAVTKIIEAKVSDYKATRKKSYRHLYDALGGIYDKFLFLDTDQDEQDRFLVQCIRKNITFKADTDLSVLLIRFYLNPSKERTSRYAHVLREATFRAIEAGELARTLRNTSIKAMASAFTDRRKESNPEPTTTQKTIKLACSDRLWEQWQENPSPVLRLTVRRQDDGTGKVKRIRAERERAKENTQQKKANSTARDQQQNLIPLSKARS